MVNPGRPSRGCQNCKNRRVKCDEGKPTCRRCQVTGRECPGYQDPWEAIFHDETNLTQNKILHLQSAASSQKAVKVVALKSRHKLKVDLLVAPILPPRFDGSSLERTAIDSMLNIWSMIPVPKHSQGWLDLVAPAYGKSPELSPIRNAFDALALCWFWKNDGRPELAQAAYGRYARAIRSTSMAITDPNRLKHNETLLSILLLASFESLDCSDSHGNAYRKHLEGAVRLVELRGTEQLKNRDSLRLFRAVRMGLLTQRLINSQSISTEGEFNWFPSSERSTDCIHEIAILGGRVADMRSQCQRVFHFVQDLNWGYIDNLITAVEELNHDIKNCQRNLPADFRHNIMSVREDNSKNVCDRSTWKGITYVYSGVFEACLEGHLHTLHIYTCAVMLRYRCLQLTLEDVNNLAFTTMPEFRSIQESVDKICYITPYSLDEMPDRAKGLSKDPYELSTAASRSMYSMLTPLVTALGIEGICESQREWMKRRLMEIGQKMGLDICDRLAKTPPHVIFQRKNPYRSG